MALKLSNNAVGLLATSLSNSDTTVVLHPGQGDLFPSLSTNDWFPLTVLKADNTREIMYATARAGDVLTVIRARENTVAQSFIVNDRAELRATAGVFGDKLSVFGGTIQGDLTVSGAFNVSSGASVSHDFAVGGNMNVLGTLMQGGQGVWHAGNLNPAAYLPLAGGTLSGNLNVTSLSPFVMMRNTSYTGSRGIHASPNGEIGFLNSSGGWSAYSSDDGTWVATGDIAAYSDRKHKREIFTIRDSLALIERMRGVRYLRRDTGKPSIGVIAQEVRDVLPEIVGEGQDGLHVDYGKIVAPLIEAVKDLAGRVRKLEGRP